MVAVPPISVNEAFGLVTAVTDLMALTSTEVPGRGEQPRICVR